MTLFLIGPTKLKLLQLCNPLAKASWHFLTLLSRWLRTLLRFVFLKLLWFLFTVRNAFPIASCTHIHIWWKGRFHETTLTLSVQKALCQGLQPTAEPSLNLSLDDSWAKNDFTFLNGWKANQKKNNIYVETYLQHDMHCYKSLHLLSH
jgi:hypothetical protein